MAPPACVVIMSEPARSRAAAWLIPSAGPTGASRGSMVVLSKFTKRFRIVMEESFKHERPEVRSLDRRWYEIIPCRSFKAGPCQEGAFIGLYSEDPPTLQLYTPRVGNAKNIWKQIRNEPGCRADFHMDGEAVLYFPLAFLDLMAELAEARKKRQSKPLTEEQKAKLVEMGKAYRFKGKAAGPQTQNQTQSRPLTLPSSKEAKGERNYQCHE